MRKIVETFLFMKKADEASFLNESSFGGQVEKAKETKLERV